MKTERFADICSERIQVKVKLYPLAKEGWLRHQENVAKPQKPAQTGWSLTTKRFGTPFPETFSLSGHPVRSFKGGFATSFDVAATPPSQAFARRGIKPGVQAQPCKGGVA